MLHRTSSRDRGFLSAAALVLFAAVFVSGPIRAEDSDQNSVSSHAAVINKTVKGILLPSDVGGDHASVHMVSIPDGTVLFDHNADRLKNPASNAKIVTAYAALRLLGPEFRFRTALYGKVDGAAVTGPLYLKGYADPTLDYDAVAGLVLSLKRRGIRRIEGGVVVDDAYFDEEVLPYAYDQQPKEDSPFRAPVGAVSVDANSIKVYVRPGSQPGAPIRVETSAPGYAVVENEAVTSAAGGIALKMSSMAFEDRTKLRLRGTFPLGTSRAVYAKRIDDPGLFAGYVLNDILKKMGIHTSGRVKKGRVARGAGLLASRDSQPLSSVLWSVGKMSNNFYAETVLKTMGAEIKGAPGTWEKGIKCVQGVLEDIGIKAGAYEYRNGSGLFDANAFSAEQLTAVLSAAFRDVTVQPEFLMQLATGGVDGTIKSRYRKEVTKRHVRAKTGTLRDVSALSGYILDDNGGGVAFSILIDGIEGKVYRARKLQEEIVTSVADIMRDESNK